MSVVRTLLSLIFAFLTVAVCRPALAQVPPPAGILDTSFGTGGVASHVLPGYVTRIYGMDVQADGKILLAGSAWAGGDYQRAMVMRLHANGSLDTSFGTNGASYYGPNVNLSYTARRIEVMSNGKIMVAGDTGTSVFVYRLQASGTADFSYSSSTLAFTSQVKVAGLGVQSSGQSVVAFQANRNNASDTDVYVYRFYENGSVDSSFNAYSGRYTYSTINNDTAAALLVQPDDKVLVGGSSNNSSQIFVTRLTESGTPDSSFVSSSGRYDHNYSAYTPEELRALALDSSNHILILTRLQGASNDVALTRLTPSGQADIYFGQHGNITTSLGSINTVPTAILVQPDRRIVIGAHQQIGAGNNKFWLKRLEWFGAVDESFGSSGLLGVESGSTDVESAALHAGPDGTLLLAGSSAEVNGYLRASVTARVSMGPLLTVPEITITQEPVAQTVEIGESFTLTVEASGVADPIYSWYRGGILVKRSAEAFLTQTGAPSSEGTYHVEVRSSGVAKNSQQVMVKVLQPPVVAALASELIGYNGSDTKILGSISAGRYPMNVQWFKGETVVNEQILYYPSPLFWLNFNPTSPDMAGSYHFTVTNSDGEATGASTELKIMTNPSLSLPVAAAVVPLGGYAALQVQPYSSLEYRLQWYKNGKVVTKANSKKVDISDAEFDDAALYTVRISSLLGKYTSEELKLSVVDLRARKHMAAAGKPYTLEIPVRDFGLTYQWLHEGEPLEDGDGISGAATAKLTFASMAEEHVGNYTCTISAGQTELVTAGQELKIATAAPVLGSIALPAARLGSFYAAPLPLPEQTATLEIKGLPAGFFYSPEEGELYGTPTKAGSFKLTVTAVNPLGKSASVQVTLVVEGFPAERRGRFYGLVSSGPSEGIFDITVTSTGSYTGKLTVCNKYGKTASTSFKGVFSLPWVDGLPPEPGAEHTASSTINLGLFAPYYQPSTVTLRLRDHGINGWVLFHRQHRDGNFEEQFDLYAPSCPWTAKNPLGSAYRGTYNIAWSPGGHAPGGTSFSRATVSAAGVMGLSGKMSDGTGITLSAPVTAQHESNGFIPLYGSRGGVGVNLTINPGIGSPAYLDSHLSGNLHWSKYADSYKGQKNNPISFDDGLSMTGGSKYLPPNYEDLTGPLMLNARLGENNVDIDVFGTATNGTLKTNHKVAVDMEPGQNARGLRTISFNAATGLFSGSGVFVYDEEVYDPVRDVIKYVTRRQPYTIQGLVVRNSTDLTSTGHGYGLLPEVVTDGERYYKLNASYGVSVNPSY